MCMKILITGNSGYIGSHLTNILLKNNNFIIYGIDKIDPQVPVHIHYIQDIKESHDWNIEEEFDCVIHLAAEVAVGESVLNPILYYLTNTLGTFNVLTNIKFKKFILASTGSAGPMNNPYGISKRAAEDIVTQYCLQNKIPFTIFRFFNVTGADGFNPTNADGLMWNLINAKNTGIFNLFGNDYNTEDGSAVRDYTHVNEICYSIIEGLTTPSNQIENLGHGIGTTVIQMINIFKSVNNCEFEVIVCPRRDGDLETSVLDTPSRYMKKLYNITTLLKIADD